MSDVRCRRKEDAGQEDEARAFLLDKATVKCMRGLLVSMMGQRQKVEAFKTTLSDKESINIVTKHYLPRFSHFFEKIAEMLQFSSRVLLKLKQILSENS